MTKNEEEIRKNIESLLVPYQELMPSTGPRTVAMLEAGCSAQEYYQALIEQYQAVKNGKNEEKPWVLLVPYQELMPSTGPRTVVMLEAGCSSYEYYLALIEQYQAVKNGKYPY